MDKIKVTLEDRLRAENLQLQMETIQKDLQLIQLTVQAKITSRDELVRKMTALKEEFQKKYNIDLAQVKIEDDGSVSPMAPATLPGAVPSST